jgi:hypothetical protein
MVGNVTAEVKRARRFSGRRESPTLQVVGLEARVFGQAAQDAFPQFGVVVESNSSVHPSRANKRRGPL